MFSFDPSYSNGDLCVEFKGSNLVGYANMFGLLLMANAMLYTIGLAFYRGVTSFSQGEYVALTTFYVRDTSFGKFIICVAAVAFVLVQLLLPYTIFFNIQQDTLDAVDTGRMQLLWGMLVNLASTYVALFLSFWYLTKQPEQIVNTCAILKSNVEFKRSSKDLFTQSNRAFEEQLVKSIVSAKFGQTQELQAMLKGGYDVTSIDTLISVADPRLHEQYTDHLMSGSDSEA